MSEYGCTVSGREGASAPLLLSLYDSELNIGNFHDFEKNGWITFHREDPTLALAIYTDRQLDRVRETNHEINVAWLLESPALTAKAHRRLRQLERYFDCILTFRGKYLARKFPYRFCPMGTSWIAPGQWGLHPKSRDLSIICSRQNYLPGHKLRFEVVRHARRHIDGLFGHAFEPIKFKWEGLRDFRFSIAIENCREDYYFSEKLIDCFALGVVPVYWGCPSIGHFFDTAGMVVFSSRRQLMTELNSLTKDRYQEMLPAVKRNFEIARSYMTLEWPLFQALKGWAVGGRPLV